MARLVEPMASPPALAEDRAVPTSVLEVPASASNPNASPMVAGKHFTNLLIVVQRLKSNHSTAKSENGLLPFLGSLTPTTATAVCVRGKLPWPGEPGGQRRP